MTWLGSAKEPKRGGEPEKKEISNYDATRYYNKTLKEEENRRSKKYLTMMQLGITTKP